MQNVSESVALAITSDVRTFGAKIVCGSTTIDKGFISIKTEGRTTADNRVSIGTSCATIVEIEMEESEIDLVGKEFALYFTIADEEILQGYFVAQKPLAKDGKITFTAYDRMASVNMLEKYYSNLEYPCDIADVCNEITDMTGYQFEEVPTGIVINKRAVATDGENTEYCNPFDNCTFRETLGYLSGLLGKYACIGRNGKIVFRWYSETDVRVTNSVTSAVEVGQDVREIGYLECNIATDTVLRVGEGVTGISFNNFLMTEDTLQRIYSTIHGLLCVESSFTFWGNPTLEIGDIIALEHNGNEYSIPIMSIVHDFDGGITTTVSSYATTVQEESNSTSPMQVELSKIQQSIAKIQNLVVSSSLVVGKAEEIIDSVESWRSTEDTTLIDGGKIYTRSIKADSIDTENLFAQNIEATGTIKGLTLEGASGKFTEEFDVTIPLSVDDLTYWIMRASEGLVEIGVENNSDDPLADRQTCYMQMANGSFHLYGYGNLNLSSNNSITLRLGGGIIAELISEGYGGDRYGTIEIPLTFTDFVELCNGLTVSGAFASNGTATFKGATFNDSVTLKGTLTHSGTKATFSGITTFDGAVSFANASTFNGASTFKKGVAFTGNDSHSGVATFNSKVYLKNVMYGVDGNGEDRILVNANVSDKIYFGPTGDNADQTIFLRGANVRLYSNVSGGGVYLGSTGSVAITSDENLKELSEIDERYIAFFESLKPLAYVYKDMGEKTHHRKHLGFGARAVEKALLDNGISTEEFAGVVKQTNVTLDADEMGTEEDVFFEELYSLRYEEFIALNTLMLQRANEKISTLEEKVARLETLVEKLLEK